MGHGIAEIMQIVGVLGGRAHRGDWDGPVDVRAPADSGGPRGRAHRRDRLDRADRGARATVKIVEIVEIVEIPCWSWRSWR